MKAPRNQQANFAVDWINNLTHCGDYVGEPFDLRPFQEDIIRRIFGTLDHRGKRRYRKVTFTISRGAGKTQLSAAIALLFLIGFGKRDTHVVSAATSSEQAAEVFRAARVAVENDAYLSSVCQINASRNEIVYLPTKSWYKAVSSGDKSKLGGKPSLVIIDELQSFSTRSETELYNNLVSGLGKRQETLLIQIMTGGDNRSLGYKEFEHARRVEKNPNLEPWHLPILYYADESDDWYKLSTLRKANPALCSKACGGKPFADVDYFKRERARAKNQPYYQTTYKQRYLCQFPSATEAWITTGLLDHNNKEPLEDKETIYTAGADFASVADTNALVLFGVNPDGTYDVIPFFWVSETQMENRYFPDFSYKQWYKQGHLQVVPGKTTDHALILDEIINILNEYGVTKLGIDPNGVENWLVNRLMETGFDVGGIKQNASNMSGTYKRMERELRSGKMRLGNHPVLRWQLENARLYTTTRDEYLVLKGKSFEKVDGCIALACAMYVADLKDDKPKLNIGEHQKKLIVF